MHKGPKARAATEEAGTPSRPNGGEGRPTPKKTAFVEDFLRREPEANVAAVNRAWSDAGHEGKISDSVFYKIKREFGEAGGRGATTGTKPEPAAKASAVRSGSVRPEADSEPTTRTSLSTPRAGQRERVLDRVEDRIDDLIGELKQLGGLEDALEALKKARRVVVRSHEG